MADSVGIGAPITSVSALEPRLLPGIAVTPAQSSADQGSGRQQPPSEPPTQLAIGTVIEAVVRAPAGKGPPAGTHLLLRVVAPTATGGELVAGTVVDVSGNETLVATPIGLLALQQRLALAPGTAIAFIVIETAAPAGATASPVPMRSGWRALEETLLALLDTAPVLADELRAELTPQSGPELAGTLLFLVSALYQGKWPGPTIINALGENHQQKLISRLADDVAALRRLSDDQTTGEWRVLTLPLLVGNLPLAVRLYLNRRKPATAQDGIRFALEVELSRFGPVQLDAMLRGHRLILVVRSHRDLTPEQRQEMRALLQTALAGTGLAGDLSFATVANFLVRPLDTLRGHIKITA
ncbi:MAG TPA: hypothetical protein VGL83_08505 [Stellaceae bacterium]